MKRNISVSILFLLTMGALQAQTLEATFKMAEDFNAQSNFDQAITAYRRVIFFDSTQQYAHLSYKGLAESYYRAMDFNLAAYYFDLAYYSSPNDSEKNYFVIQKSASFIQLGDFSSALTELFSIDTDNNVNEEFLRSFYTAYAYFGMGNYAQSEETTLKYYRKHNADTLTQVELINTFKQLGKSIKKASRAGIYSRIIPGWGQWYAGDKRAAVNSFVLVGSLAIAGGHTLLTVGLLDAATVFGPWFYRYYSGGFGKAEKIAIAKNMENSSFIFKGILDEWVYFYDSKVKEQL